MLSERAYTYKHRKEHLESLMELNKDLKTKLVQVKVFHVRFFWPKLGSLFVINSWLNYSLISLPNF